MRVEVAEWSPDASAALKETVVVPSGNSRSSVQVPTSSALVEALVVPKLANTNASGEVVPDNGMLDVENVVLVCSGEDIENGSVVVAAVVSVVVAVDVASFCSGFGD